MDKEKAREYRPKMNKEELQDYLRFRRRGSKVSPKKGKGSYDRKKWRESD